MDFQQLIETINMSRAKLAGVGRVFKWGISIVAVSYIGASAASAYFMSSMVQKTLVIFTKLNAQVVTPAAIKLSSSVNYNGIEKVIKERNLFNSSGEFPDEKDPSDKSDATKVSTFDINAACGKPTVNVSLVGTIYLAGSNSVATLQEQGYSESDIYREGDTVVGNERVSIVKIERNKVVLNNNGIKECLELAVEAKPKAADGFPSTQPSDPNAVSVPGESTPGGAVANSDCALEEKYVQDELGPGFATIITKARLVPNTTDNQMNGFKIFAIDQGSLLGKTGLHNGDIITQVNDTSLKQPEQGFALYQAFQDEKEVRLHILRNGAQAMMITCRIK